MVPCSLQASIVAPRINEFSVVNSVEVLVYFGIAPFEWEITTKYSNCIVGQEVIVDLLRKKKNDKIEKRFISLNANLAGLSFKNGVLFKISR